MSDTRLSVVPAPVVEGYDEVTVQEYIDSLAALEDDSDDKATRQRAFAARLALLAALTEADALLS